MTESEQRAAVVAEAISWASTPFHMNGTIKGPRGGVDCGRYPALVYRACGLTVPDLPAHWPRDFCCHAMADADPYIALIQQALVEVEVPLPGDLAVFKPLRSRCYSHAAIVVGWPNFIHARGVGGHPQVEEGVAGAWPLELAAVRFFSPFAQ
jgi:cell wall-associated NlpC family hydrolase